MMTTFTPHDNSSYKLVKYKSLPSQLVSLPLIENALSEMVGVKLNIKYKLCLN